MKHWRVVQCREYSIVVEANTESGAYSAAAAIDIADWHESDISEIHAQELEA